MEDLKALVEQLDEDKSGPISIILKALEDDYNTQVEVNQAERAIMKGDVSEIGKLKADIVQLIEKVDDLTFQHEFDKEKLEQSHKKIDRQAEENERLKHEIERLNDLLNSNNSKPMFGGVLSKQPSIGSFRTFFRRNTGMETAQVVDSTPTIAGNIRSSQEMKD